MVVKLRSIIKILGSLRLRVLRCCSRTVVAVANLRLFSVRSAPRRSFCCVGRRATGTFCRPANEHRMAHEGRTGFQLPGDIGASPASMTVLILDDGVSYRRVPPRAAGCRDLSFSFPVKDLNGWTTYRLVRRSAAKERPPSEPTVRRP